MEDKYFNKEDVRFILDEIKYEIFQPKQKQNRLIRLLRLYALLGVLVFILGSIYFVTTLIEFHLNSDQRLSLIFAMSGLVISFLSYFLVISIKEKEKENAKEKQDIEKKKRKFENISHFLFLWADFEQYINYLTSRYQNHSKYSIKQNLEILLRNNKISEVDFFNIEKALKLRNKIVHISPDEIDDLEEDIENIVQMIHKIESEMKD